MLNTTKAKEQISSIDVNTNLPVVINVLSNISDAQTRNTTAPIKKNIISKIFKTIIIKNPPNGVDGVIVPISGKREIKGFDPFL